MSDDGGDEATDDTRVRLVADATADLLSWHADVVERRDSEFEAARNCRPASAHPAGYVGGGGDAADGDANAGDTAVTLDNAQAVVWRRDPRE